MRKKKSDFILQITQSAIKFFSLSSNKDESKMNHEHYLRIIDLTLEHIMFCTSGFSYVQFHTYFYHGRYKVKYLFIKFENYSNSYIHKHTHTLLTIFVIVIKSFFFFLEFRFILFFVSIISWKHVIFYFSSNMDQISNFRNSIFFI